MVEPFELSPRLAGEQLPRGCVGIGSPLGEMRGQRRAKTCSRVGAVLARRRPQARAEHHELAVTDLDLPREMLADVERPPLLGSAGSQLSGFDLVWIGERHALRSSITHATADSPRSASLYDGAP